MTATSSTWGNTWDRGWTYRGTETGIFGDIISGFNSIADTIAGGPAKRERQARAEAEAAAAMAQIEQARLDLARVQAGQTGGGGFSLMGASPVFGLPWLAVLGLGAVGLYIAFKR